MRSAWYYILLVAFSACNRQPVLFKRLPASITNIDFINKLEKKEGFGILYYLYYYNGGGVSIGDINNDGLRDIYFTANSRGNNKLYLNKGNFEFEDITAKAGIPGNADWCTGSTMADVNGDGFLDIYVSVVSNSFGLQGHNQLYINNRNNSFTESSQAYGLNFSGFSTQAAFFDYDHDGDVDCYLLNQSHNPYQNIVDTSNRRKIDAYAGDRLYRNNSVTTAGDTSNISTGFTDITGHAGIYQSNLGYGLGLAVADLNNDGWEDIYVGNDFHENDYYYVNNGNGTFTESGAKHFNHYSRFSMGNDVADYNNDGQLDLITVDMLPDDEKVLKTYGSDENPDIYNFKIIKNGFQHQYSKNCLQQNNGNGSSFSEISLLAGVSATDWSWAPLFADFDNDGKKDLFISSGIVKRPVDLDYVKFVSGLVIQKQLSPEANYDDMALEKMPDGKSHPYFFRGNGAQHFENTSDAWGSAEIEGYFNGAAYADLDNDGRIDMVINAINSPAVVLKNNGPKKNYLSLSFNGNGINTSGIGCKAYIFAGNKMQYQQLMLTRGFQSSSDNRLHFGLGDMEKVDSVLIVWPDQKYQVLKAIAVNKQHTILQTDATSIFNYETYFKSFAPRIDVVAPGMNMNWKHKENEFFDFNIQYLLPHAESTRGPKIAVGDINGDGLQDMFTCGAKGQAGVLMIQKPGGQFINTDTAMFAADAQCEDVDALFFDANGDAYLDLYVVSGGNQPVNDPVLLQDRLYINDGKGHLTKAMNLLPVISQNKSCVTTADIDNDGDKDLFVGSLANPVAYGIPQTSYLLINDGNGKFTIANENNIPLMEIGMVTCATFSDIDKNGWADLLVAGEFMPMTVFKNKKGKFEKSVVANSTGWWQTIFIDDVNQDGYADILAGNWGWNNKFQSGKNGPVNLYVSDFDKNGRTDHLLSYTLNSKEYPFLAKDEVERALPTLKKHYLLYAEYANVPMKEVFYGWIDTIRPLVAERLGSAIFYGDGRGGFTINDLPTSLQLAPIFSFQKFSKRSNSNQYVSGGNFFDVIPYEGRYDAQPLALFSIDKNKKVTYIHQPELQSVKGQVRDLKWITNSNNMLLIVARNNDSLLLRKMK